ncbi:MAG: glycosyltransferase [Prevotella sp.]|nr:glycosyltransferase [Prevotella sp.]
MKLLLEKIRLAILKRTKRAPQKSYAAWVAKGYNDTPEVSIIIQSHDKSLQVCHILPKLRHRKDIEIIVIDDGSSLEHTQRLAQALTGANEFLLRANDLYENRTYDKAIRLSNGKYIVLLQDDDDFDSDVQWMAQAIGYFKQHPRLAIIGGNWGLRIDFDDENRWGHGMRDETLKSGEFRFVPSVNRAPMWIRRDLFMEHLHHIDADFAPFQYDDDELCLRAWLSGLQVGWYDARFRSLSAGGMRLWNKGFTGEQSQRNGKRLYSMYAHHMKEILEKVREANG